MTEKPFSTDWEEFVSRHRASGVEELDLDAIKPGDTLMVLTRGTAYTFSILGRDMAMLTTNRADRPAGRVRINGCTFGKSSTIQPDRLFCGGNLEFIHGDNRQVYTTTEIQVLRLTHDVPRSGVESGTGAPSADPTRRN